MSPSASAVDSGTSLLFTLTFPLLRSAPRLLSPSSMRPYVRAAVCELAGVRLVGFDWHCSDRCHTMITSSLQAMQGSAHRF